MFTVFGAGLKTIGNFLTKVLMVWELGYFCGME
jgi:hypothetical protein